MARAEQLTFAFDPLSEVATGNLAAASVDAKSAQSGPDAVDVPTPPEAPVIVKADPLVPMDAQRSAQRLTATLAEKMGEPIRLVITDNRRTMVSGARKSGRLELRLHRMFLDAPPAVVDALHGYLAKRRRSAGQVIDRFIESKRDTIRARARSVRIRTRGTHHDLRSIFEQLEAAYFHGQLEDVRITWGRRSTRKRRQRSIRLGTYVMSERLIRVHPVLDNSWVPRFYVESVVHHEMLHHVLPPERQGDRTCFHTPEFRRRERGFEHHREAERWESQYLDKLLKNAHR